jgi:hypothetical protein
VDTEASKIIALHLDDINHLFIEPELNPFLNCRLYNSGIEEIISTLRREKSIKDIQLRVFIPEEQITPDLARETKDALETYGEYQIGENQNELDVLRNNGWRALFLGIFVVVAVYLLGGLITEQEFIPKVTGGILLEGLTILSWVMIWHPLGIFLYDLSPYRQNIRTYRAISRAEVFIESE